MNWEDFPLLSTQPLGLQSNGTVVKLFPPAISTRTVSPPLRSPMWNLNPPPLESSLQLETIISATPALSAIQIVAGGPSLEGFNPNQLIPTPGWWVFYNIGNFTNADVIYADGSSTLTPHYYSVGILVWTL